MPLRKLPRLSLSSCFAKRNLTAGQKQKRRPCSSSQDCAWPPFHIAFLFFYTFYTFTFLPFHFYALPAGLYDVDAVSGQGDLHAAAVGVGARHECAAYGVDFHRPGCAANSYAATRGCHCRLSVGDRSVNARRCQLNDVGNIFPCFSIFTCFQRTCRNVQGVRNILITTKYILFKCWRYWVKRCYGCNI